LLGLICVLGMPNLPSPVPNARKELLVAGQVPHHRNVEAVYVGECTKKAARAAFRVPLADVRLPSLGCCPSAYGPPVHPRPALHFRLQVLLA
jgi:hypothetical protein